MTDSSAVGANVRRLRVARGWDEARLAADTGFHPSLIASLERGQTSLPHAGLARLAATLDTTVAVLQQAAPDDGGQPPPAEPARPTPERGAPGRAGQRRLTVADRSNRNRSEP